MEWAASRLQTRPGGRVFLHAFIVEVWRRNYPEYSCEVTVNEKDTQTARVRAE